MKNKLGDFEYKAIEHLAQSNCNCASNRQHIEHNMHLPSCWVGKSQKYLGQKVVFYFQNSILEENMGFVREAPSMMNINLSYKLHNRIRDLANKERVSVSELVRTCMEEYLEKEEGKKR